MKQVRLALVGCGPRGIGVAGQFAQHPQCKITALVDRFPSHLNIAAEQLQNPSARLYADVLTMLRDAPVEAVFFASDPTEQADLACEAMEAGKHVCTEVPAAVTLDQLWRLVRTVRRTGCKYQLMEQARYWGFVDAWKALRERGELGHICLAQGEYVHYERWDCWVDAETGEVYHDYFAPAGRRILPTWRQKVLSEPIYYLPHTLSPLLKILDDRVVKVSCMGTKRPSYTFPEQGVQWTDIQYALMHTAGDTVMLVGAGFSLPCIRRIPRSLCHWYELRGSRGTVTSPRSFSDKFRLWKPGMTDFEPMDLSLIPIGATAEQAQSGHGGADFRPVETFIRSILDDTEPPMNVLLTAEMTAPAIVAAQSARQGGALLEVPDFRAEKQV